MAHNNRKPKMLPYTLKAFQKQFPDDATCLEWLRNYLYPDGIYCNACESVTKHHRVKSRPSYSCDHCGHHVHPTAGTIFHKSPTPLTTWFYAIYLMASTRCGISAKQIQRETGVTYKTAWRMFKQIRTMLDDEKASPLGGKSGPGVEMDEMYYGGRRKGSVGRPMAGDHKDKKVTVIGMVERKGRVRAVIAADVKGSTMLGLVKEHCIIKAAQYGPLHIRLNRRGGGFVYVQVDAEWIYPEDASVDLAVLPFVPQADVVEFRMLDSSLVAADDLIAKHSIGIGDDLVVCGLFTKHVGKTQKNLPIVRCGNIAAMPSEPFPDKKTGLPFHAYLIEARSIGGLSGSPVFAFLGPGRAVKGKVNLSQMVTVLIGVVRGHWDHEEASVDSEDFSGKEANLVNMGIAIATPSQELHKILFSEEWVNKRREHDKSVAMKQPSITEDDAFKKPFTKEDFEGALKKASRKVEPSK